MVERDRKRAYGLDHVEGSGERADLGRCLVTGGAGYFGRNLVKALLELGYHVSVLDVVPLDFEHERLHGHEGDLRRYDDVLAATQGVDTVFHTASVVELLKHCPPAIRERNMAINVGGTENVIRACRESGVTRLVYTSSSNVIFDGREIEMADETHPYPARYGDLYSETKSLAERKVLAANGEDGLLTCAIRPSGIYGPQEKLILPRVAERADDGLFVVTLGPPSSLTEFSYVDNVVEGHLLAAERLVADSPVPGQAYFINDGEYRSTFEYFRPLIEGLGFRFPRISLPITPFKIAATIWELAYRYLWAPYPPLTVVEVVKTGLRHPNSIEKARRELGYEPVVTYEQAMERCLPYCQELLRRRERVHRPHPAWWLTVILGMVALGFVAHHPASWQLWSQHVVDFIPQWAYRVVLWSAVLVNIRFALEAVRLAERAELHRTSTAWGWQSLIVGFASFRLLQPVVARRMEQRAKTR